jgi:alpha-glucosidase
MKFLQSGLLIVLLLVSALSIAQKSKTYTVTSPNGNITVTIESGEKFRWSVKHKGQTIITPSSASLQLETGETLGNKAVITSAKPETVNTSFAAINYKKKTIQDNYNQLTINCKGDYGIIFRTYNDGIAYRFFTKKKTPFNITGEEAAFNFDKDYNCLLPYVRDLRGKEQYVQSFEALYTPQKLSEVYKDSIAFLPVLVDVGNGKKVVILDADLEEYPGMYLKALIL